jgi:predicted Zn-dependent peptidase
MLFNVLLLSILGCGCQCIYSLRIATPNKSPQLFPRIDAMSRGRITKISSYVAGINSNKNKWRTNVFMSSAVASSFSSNMAIELPNHPSVLEGYLSNGLRYIILPNRVPVGRFEAHLEVMSGSAKELDHQQGMAHLLEHVAYMGSPKRQLISGTGSKTNAYTDFHHTVFYAACPSMAPDSFWSKPMLPMALEALLDAMTTPIDNERLEKERAAVLSEASMVNKMEYRVECQILSTLHKENRISKRFPIGKEHLIKRWTREDLQLYHKLHYRPDNAVLYVVGDIDANVALDAIRQKFEGLKPQIDASKVFKDSKEFPEVSMLNINRHFPPVLHRWSCTEAKLHSLLPSSLGIPKIDETMTDIASSHDIEQKVLKPVTTVFQHELLQTFSFHLFGKCPIEPIRTKESFKREIVRKMILGALQVRLNVLQRSDPLFTFADFNYINWPREGCAVTSLDLTTDVSKWRMAVTVAIQEIRRLGLYGLTSSEFDRYRKAAISEASHMATQCEQRNNEEILAEVMNCEANGHTIIEPQFGSALTQEIMEELSLADVGVVARDLCEFLSHFHPSTGVKPVAVVACAPLNDRNGDRCEITESELSHVVNEALLSPLEPLLDMSVPCTLLSGKQVAEKLQANPPRWSTLEGKALNEVNNKVNVIQKRLENGIRVNFKHLEDEPNRVSVRMYVPGGRMHEARTAPGSIALGARTMQEGGAFLNMTREEVELFCIDHHVMVEIIPGDDALIFDFQGVTTDGPGVIEDLASGKIRAVTGIEALMQVAHIILTDFTFEADAFERARQSLHEQFDSTAKSLESACHESLIYSLTSGDSRFMTPNHKQIEALSLDVARQSVQDQLVPSKIEVTMVGDVSLSAMEKLALTYLGTVPTKKLNANINSSGQINTTTMIQPRRLQVSTLGRNQQLGVYLPDADERAMGYIAGPAPNKWGVYEDSKTLGEKMQEKFGTSKKDSRRDHPLFGHACLMIFQEIANRRLFSVVREEKQLTYDAAFQLQSFESILGGWYIVSVTSSPHKVQQAIRACKEALVSLKVLRSHLFSFMHSFVLRFQI